MTILKVIRRLVLVAISFSIGWIVGSVVFFIAVVEHFRSVERGREAGSNNQSFAVRVARRIRR